MSRQGNDTLFLEELLRINSGTISTFSSIATSLSSSSSSSARAIIQAWSEVRDSLQHQSFQPNHLQALKILLHFQTSLHVADPQAKLLLSILSSQNLSLPVESHPLFFRLLYIWVRKSFRPSSLLVDSAVGVVSKLLLDNSDANKSPELFAEAVLLLGAFAFLPSATETSKTVCLELLSRLLEEEYKLISSVHGLMPDVLAGIGYALCSSIDAYYSRILDALFGIWGKEDGPPGNVSHGLMILHLVDWIIFGYIKSHLTEKLQKFAQETLEIQKSNYVPFALVMAAAGALRALNRSIPDGHGLQIVLRLRNSAENRIESVAQNLITYTGGFSNLENDHKTSLLLQCISLALARCGSVSSRAPLLISVASALLTEIFPLQSLYARILKLMHGNPKMVIDDVKEHLNSVSFKEAGAISGVLCNQYVSIDEKNKMIVEKLIWRFCQELYSGHRQVALVLHGKEDELLRDVEKIAESAFLMVVVFALAVTKKKLNSKFSTESQMETSVSILVSFSCVEYFRRMRLPEYMDTIRGVIVSVQENETACNYFAESMPSYSDLTKPHEFLQKTEYRWFKDEVQTARILFYLRVIPTCIERLPVAAFSRVLVPTMFLYMGHPNEKVARAAHSMFVAFISSGKDSNENKRALLKEQITFFYLQRSLEGYPGITPFQGMASGIAALVRNLPAGSPAAFYCIDSLVKKANMLCSDISTQEDNNMWKNWQGESDPCKKMLELLLQLISLVDMQVLPTLMKLMAQLIIQLPKDGQTVVLNELYAQVAESDDVTRKAILVSWLQSLSYLCFQEMSRSTASKLNESEKLSLPLPEPSNWDRTNARL